MTTEITKEFRRLWKAWTEVVYGLSSRKLRIMPSRNREYVTLHGRLLRELQRLQQVSRDSATCQRYQNAADLVRPWVTLESFRCAEPADLRSLTHQCRQLDHAFLPAALRLPQRLPAGTTLLLLAGAGTVFLVLGSQFDLVPPWSQFQETLATTWRRLTRQRYMIRDWNVPLIGLVVAMLVIGFTCLQFTKK